MVALTIGDHLWNFDINNRVYSDESKGTKGPIWSKHWVEYVVVGGNLA